MTAGAEQIMKSNFTLVSLDLGKNNITSKIGTTLQYYISNSMKLQILNIEHNNLQLKGIEFLTSGLLNARALKHLNVSGNGIGDKGLKVLLRGVERHPSLQELRVSFNEITPIGGAFMIETIAKTNLKMLDMSRNVIEDETLIMLGDLYKMEAKLKMQHLNVSSCHVTDVGLLYFIEAIENADQLKQLSIRDNFISESCEKLLLELIDKNEHLTDIDLRGNRVSMSCLSRIQGKLKRNVHNQGIKEPNKLKNEVYRLNFEREKVVEAEAKIAEILSMIQRKEAEILNAKSDLQQSKANEQKARDDLEAKIIAQEDIIVKKTQNVDSKKLDIQATEDEHEKIYSVLMAKNEGRTYQPNSRNA